MILNYKHPRVIIIDDFYTDPHAVRNHALNQNFAPHPEYHKGQRGEPAPIPVEIQAEFSRLLHRRFREGYTVFQFCVAGDQLVYHCDMQSHAAVVYLTPDAPVGTGTSLIKSKITGLRAGPTEEDARQRNTTVDVLAHETFANKLLDPTAWDEVDRLGNVFNRIVLWDARMIHAATNYFGHSADNARLFQMFFFDVD